MLKRKATKKVAEKATTSNGKKTRLHKSSDASANKMNNNDDDLMKKYNSSWSPVKSPSNNDLDNAPLSDETDKLTFQKPAAGVGRAQPRLNKRSREIENHQEPIDYVAASLEKMNNSKMARKSITTTQSIDVDTIGKVTNY